MAIRSVEHELPACFHPVYAGCFKFFNLVRAWAACRQGRLRPARCLLASTAELASRSARRGLTRRPRAPTSARAQVQSDCFDEAYLSDGNMVGEGSGG